MEKIKNLLNPGKAQDDQTLYGSGHAQPETTSHTGHPTGEGTHLASIRGDNISKPLNVTGDHSPNTSATAGQHHLAREAPTGPGGINPAVPSQGLDSSTMSSSRNVQATPVSSGMAAADPHSNIDTSRTTGNAGALDSNPSTEQQYGRDAASTATGVHKGSPLRHVNNQEVTPTSGYPGMTQDTQRLEENERSGLTGSNTSSGQHHLGRDAAAIGTAGAVGEGIHHHRPNEQELGSNHGLSGATQGTSHQSGFGTTQGPHSTHTANQLDPAVNTRSSGHEDAFHHSKVHGGGAEEADHHHSVRNAAGGAGAVGLADHEHRQHQNERGTGTEHTSGLGQSTTGNTPSTSGHHYGRDAAVGAGGIGLAEHEHRKHENERSSGLGNTPNVGQSTTGNSTTTSGHHFGRDAAVGAGGVGLVEHEHRKHENERNAGHGSGIASGAATTDVLPGPAPNTAGPHSKDWMNKLDPRVDANPNKYGTGADSHNPTAHQDRHLGRDAAVAGGVGGAAYEADKHHKHDKDLTQAERDAKREHKHELKEEKREHKHELKEEKKEHKDHHLGRDTAVAGGVGGAAYEADKHHHNQQNLGGPGHSAIAGGPTTSHPAGGAQSSELPDRSRDHHYGRDAALAGGVGGAAYEAEKHHNAHQQHADTGLTGSSTAKPLPTAPGNHGIGTGAGPQNALAGGSGTQHHTGRDAALGAGAVGTAGLAAHEHNQHQHGVGVPLAEKPLGKDLGDHLHGVDRNRGVAGSSGYPGSEGYGDGTPGSFPSGMSEATTDRDGRALGSGTGNHLGRDAALGAGAGGLAAHEHKKHDSGYQGGIIGSGNNTSGQHTSGLGGIGEDEYRKSDATSGAYTSAHQPGLSGTGENYSTGVNEGVDGRNRLHKDPPLGHPAAQSQLGATGGGSLVPASGGERENMISGGQNIIDGNTGVANGHEQGINAARNY